jgi:hypothetical protein
MCHQPTAGTSAIRRFELPPFIKIPDVALSSDRDRYKSVDRIRFCQAVAGLLQELLQAIDAKSRLTRCSENLHSWSRTLTLNVQEVQSVIYFPADSRDLLQELLQGAAHWI